MQKEESRREKAAVTAYNGHCRSRRIEKQQSGVILKLEKNFQREEQTNETKLPELDPYQPHGDDGCADRNHRRQPSDILHFLETTPLTASSPALL